MPRIPKYCRQRFTSRADLAFVKIDGKRISLGPYNSPESRRRYADLISAAENPQTGVYPAPDKPTDPSISELILIWLRHLQEYFRKPDGSIGRQYRQHVRTLSLLRREYGDSQADAFGPRRLIELRDVLVESGISRKHCNEQIRRIVACFRFCVERELIPAAPEGLLTWSRRRRSRSVAWWFLVFRGHHGAARAAGC